MLISIIIPTYNRVDIIGETLDSIIAQTYQNWECIVVDDGSTDTTEALIESYQKRDSRFKFFKRPSKRTKGPNSCRNIGFEKSSGKYINFFDSDDLYKPDAFKSWMEGFKEGINAVISRIEFMNMETARVVKQNEIKSYNLIKDHFLGNISFFVCGPLWSRKFLEKQDYLFDENLRNGDDWDFNLRMLYEKPELVFLQDSYIRNRIHKSSLSKERNKLNKEELISYFKAFEHHLKFLKKIDFKGYHECELYVIRRYNFYLRHALKNKDNIKFFILKELLTKELEHYHFKYFIKTLVGFISYLLVGKGYRFFNI